MNKRKFLKQSIWVSAGASLVPSLFLSACKSTNKKEENMKTTAISATTFELPKIPYG